MPGFTLSLTVRAPVAEVFHAYTDVENAPGRIKGIVRVEKLTPGPVGLGTRFTETRVMFGREATETFEFTAFEPNARYVMTAHSCGVVYGCEFRFSPTDEGTRVDFAQSMRATSLWAKLFAPLGWLMAGAMKKVVTQDLHEMAASVEGRRAA